MLIDVLWAGGVDLPAHFVKDIKMARTKFDADLIISKILRIRNRFDLNGIFNIDGVEVTSTAAELNALDGITASVADLNALTNALAGATFVIGAEGGNVINVGIQLEDADGVDLAARSSLFAYLSDDANGDSVAGTAPDGNVAVGTDGVLIPVVADKAFQLVSEADGDIDLNIGEAAADTWYLVLVMPNGSLVVSGAITFT